MTVDAVQGIDTLAVARRVVAEHGLELRGVAGDGVDFVVYRVGCPARGELALRVPRHRVYEAPYGTVDAADLVRQEHRIAGLLAGHGLPVAAPAELVSCADGLLVSLAQFVPTDGGPVGGRETGAFLARLHQLEPVRFPLAYQAEGDFPDFLADRVAGRHEALRAFTPGLPALPDRARLRESLAQGPSGASLLHLDVRRQNLLGAGGRLTAVVDWSNALVGPPLMELARVAEYALLPDNGLEADAVLAGYAATAGALPDLWSPTAVIHRLDTALMLALVFRSVAPDPARAAELTRRADHLLERLDRAE